MQTGALRLSVYTLPKTSSQQGFPLLEHRSEDHTKRVMKIKSATLLPIRLATALLFCAGAWGLMAAAPFTVTNLPASDIAADSAQVHGVVNPSGKAARWIFQKRLAGTKKRFLRATAGQQITRGQR